MYRVDYHLHTRHSMDCQMPLDTLCEAALAANLQEICITDHTEFGHPDPTSDIPPDADAWNADIDRARDRYPSLVIRRGIEIGDNPLCRDRIVAWHNALGLDFHLLSLHLIDNADPYFPDFFDHREQGPFYRRYVESKLESVAAWNPKDYDAMAHLGYCAKFAPYPLACRPLRYEHASDAFDAIFDILAQEGKALEINVSGRKTMDECIPDKQLLTRFRERGGELVTVGSDAHLPEYVGKWLDDARALGRACGFRHLATYAGRELRVIPL